jgi:serine/threonine protein kinase
MRSRAEEIGYDEMLHLLIQLTDAIRYLHEGAPRPIIHRDLKSHNVLMHLALNRLKICDFGTAKAIAATRHHTMIGTCAWMAPEVLKGQEYSVKADIWSLGIVAWEMLTGRQPYEGLENAQILFGVGSGRLQLPVPIDCPEQLGELMKSCWQLQGSARPTASAVHDQLRAIVASRALLDKMADHASSKALSAKTNPAERWGSLNADRKIWDGELTAAFEQKQAELVEFEHQLAQKSEQLEEMKAELDRREKLILDKEERLRDSSQSDTKVIIRSEEASTILQTNDAGQLNADLDDHSSELRNSEVKPASSASNCVHRHHQQLSALCVALHQRCFPDRLKCHSFFRSSTMICMILTAVLVITAVILIVVFVHNGKEERQAGSASDMYKCTVLTKSNTVVQPRKAPLLPGLSMLGMMVDGRSGKWISKLYDLTGTPPGRWTKLTEVAGSDYDVPTGNWAVDIEQYCLVDYPISSARDCENEKGAMKQHRWFARYWKDVSQQLAKKHNLSYMESMTEHPFALDIATTYAEKPNRLFFAEDVFPLYAVTFYPKMALSELAPNLHREIEGDSEYMLASDDDFDSFIQRYGTHVVSRAVFGGRLQLMNWSTTCSEIDKRADEIRESFSMRNFFNDQKTRFMEPTYDLSVLGGREDLWDRGLDGQPRCVKENIGCTIADWVSTIGVSSSVLLSTSTEPIFNVLARAGIGRDIVDRVKQAVERHMKKPSKTFADVCKAQLLLQQECTTGDAHACLDNGKMDNDCCAINGTCAIGFIGGSTMSVCNALSREYFTCCRSMKEDHTPIICSSTHTLNRSATYYQLDADSLALDSRSCDDAENYCALQSGGSCSDPQLLRKFFDGTPCCVWITKERKPEGLRGNSCSETDAAAIAQAEIFSVEILLKLSHRCQECIKTHDAKEGHLAHCFENEGIQKFSMVLMESWNKVDQLWTEVFGKDVKIPAKDKWDQWVSTPAWVQMALDGTADEFQATNAHAFASSNASAQVIQTVDRARNMMRCNDPEEGDDDDH